MGSRVRPILILFYLVFLSYCSPAPFLIPLTNFNNVAFYAQISLGLPPQNFTVLIDTASANFWVPSNLCVSAECVDYDQYNGAASATFQTCDQPFTIDAVVKMVNNTVTGRIDKDILTIGGFINPFQSFGEAFTVDGPVPNGWVCMLLCRHWREDRMTAF